MYDVDGSRDVIERVKDDGVVVNILRKGNLAESPNVAQRVDTVQVRTISEACLQHDIIGNLVQFIARTEREDSAVEPRWRASVSF